MIDKIIKSHIDQFTDPEYVKYIELLKKATSVKNTDSMIEIYTSDTNTIYKYSPPVYKNIGNEISKLYKLYNQYCIEYITSGKLNGKLQKISNDIIVMQYLDVVLNSEMVRNISELKERINKLNKNILAEPDYEKIINLQDQLHETIDKIKILLDQQKVEKYIFKQPKLISTETKESKKAKKATKTEKPDKKPKEENISDSDIKQFPFHKLPVKILSTEECNSRSSKKPFFISLKDLISAIDNDDELKSIFGPSYKKMSKKELCSVMFKKK